METTETLLHADGTNCYAWTCQT